MLTKEGLKQLTNTLNLNLSRILKKLDKMEKRQLTKKDLSGLESKIDTFIYYLKRLETKQQILEEKIAEIQENLQISSHN